MTTTAEDPLDLPFGSRFIGMTQHLITITALEELFLPKEMQICLPGIGIVVFRY
jgi:hypothetical protein